MGNFEPRCSYKIVLTSKSVYFFYFLPLVSAWLNIRSQATLESMAASLLIQASRNSRLRFATTGHVSCFLVVVIHRMERSVLHFVYFGRRILCRRKHSRYSISKISGREERKVIFKYMAKEAMNVTNIAPKN